MLVARRRDSCFHPIVDVLHAEIKDFNNTSRSSSSKETIMTNRMNAVSRISLNCIYKFFLIRFAGTKIMKPK